MLSALFALLLAAPDLKHVQPQPAPAADDVQVQTKDELSDDEVREQVNAYLGSIDTPIRANQWKALGPRAVPLLERIARSHDELPTRRARAIDGLVALADRRAPALFKQIAARESEPINVRLSAVAALSLVTPRRRAAEVLKPILEGAGDPRLRALAAEQIAIRSRGKSCDLVRARVERETEQARAQFQRALLHCRPPK
jgi:hypothetical protein